MIEFNMYSTTTERKIRKLEEVLGSDWKERNPTQSIDSLYVQVIGDERENLFCKVYPGTKQMLKDVAKDSDCSMTEMLQILIEKSYNKMIKRQQKDAEELAKQFSQVGE